jgi:hypothetical protein
MSDARFQVLSFRLRVATLALGKVRPVTQVFQA